jgi:hypothetical protein
MLALIEATRRKSLQDAILHIHRYENLKSYMTACFASILLGTMNVICITSISWPSQFDVALIGSVSLGLWAIRKLIIRLFEIKTYKLTDKKYGPLEITITK